MALPKSASNEESEAVEVFELALRKKALPTKVEDLVPLSFIGQTAVKFYRDKIKLMDQLEMTEAQREATLRDGQQAGELLLDIEARIGEIALKETRAGTPPVPDRGGRHRGSKPSGKPPKHERLGLKERHMRQAQRIAQNPDVVARVKAKAKSNEDIPTKTAVLAEIRYEKEKARRKAVEGKRKEIKLVVAIEQSKYINALDRVISILPKAPPKTWNDELLKEATAKAKIIIKRLEVFNG